MKRKSFKIDKTKSIELLLNNLFSLVKTGKF